MEKNIVETKQWLDKGYEDCIREINYYWYAEFKRGRTNTDDAERSGLPKSAVVSENIKKVKNSFERP